MQQVDKISIKKYNLKDKKISLINENNKEEMKIEVNQTEINKEKNMKTIKLLKIKNQKINFLRIIKKDYRVTKKK